MEQYIFSSDKIHVVQQSFIQPALWNKMFSRKLIIENDLDFAEDIFYGEDLAFVPRALYFCQRFATVEQPLYHYVLRTEGSYTNSFEERHLIQTQKVVELLDDFFRNRPDFIEYIYSLNFLKAIRKAKILRSGWITSKYVHMYPEIKFTFLYMSFDVKTKLILSLSQCRLTFLLKILVRFLYKT